MIALDMEDTLRKKAKALLLLCRLLSDAEDGSQVRKELFEMSKDPKVAAQLIQILNVRGAMNFGLDELVSSAKKTLADIAFVPPITPAANKE